MKQSIYLSRLPVLSLANSPSRALHHLFIYLACPSSPSKALHVPLSIGQSLNGSKPLVLGLTRSGDAECSVEAEDDGGPERVSSEGTRVRTAGAITGVGGERWKVFVSGEFAA